MLADISANVFITNATAAKDATAMIPYVPDDVTAVIAIARSGLMPGMIFAAALHVPLFATSPVRPALVQMGSGYRLAKTNTAVVTGSYLIVDDTAASGGTMQTVLQGLAATIDARKAYTAVIYAAPDAARNVDIVGRIYPLPHYLEWNFANTVWTRSMAFDFDGILCLDPTSDDVQGSQYEEFLENAGPLYLPKSHPAVIVSARCEWTRAASMRWLERHGVQVKKLVLWHDRDDQHWKTPHIVAKWKAASLRELADSDDIDAYAESDPVQAAIIAEEAGIPVVCPAAKWVFTKKGAE